MLERRTSSQHQPVESGEVERPKQTRLRVLSLVVPKNKDLSAHPVTLPEASCQFMPVVIAKEAFPKPALEDDNSVKPVSVTPVPVKPTPVTLDPVKPIPVTSDTVKPASVSPKPVKSAPVSQTVPIQPVMVKEAVSETFAVVSPEAAPEWPALSALAMEAIPQVLIQPIMATEAITEHPTLPATDMETIPNQPVVLAAEAF
ncbi:DUF1566 domain-containing [Labeo rohita]|uniref:DUF1566 domain-containing n=1 Tax=Labeo rohita TaxID=84645 RepID=A0A498LW61_LABRO|nr:DUF1566 domain-containing [Labeo rohita]